MEPVERPACGEAVQHDGFRVEFAAVGLVHGVRVEHVVLDSLRVPVVGGPAEGGADRRLVPLDEVAARVLVLVSAALLKESATTTSILFSSGAHGWTKN